MLSFAVTTGNQPRQIVVSLLILNQQHQAKRGIGILRVMDPDIDTEYWLDPCRIGRLIEFDQCEKIALIGDGNRRHLHIGCRPDQRFDPDKTVHQRVFRVDAEMYEGGIHGLDSTNTMPPISATSHGDTEARRRERKTEGCVMTQVNEPMLEAFSRPLGTDQSREYSIELDVDFCVTTIFNSVSPCLRVRQFVLARIWVRV